ncbi:MAG: UDP-glucose 4-epimerase [Caldimonas sp.]|nr:MAG: UDP-glucose 4-epimerase [Caldimonas sp.]
MKVLVTGASGFTGAHLLPALCAAGHEVVALGHPARQTSPPEVRWRACDLADPCSVQHAVAGLRVDGVVHLGAISYVAHGEADAFYRVNLLGTRHLLESLCQLDAAPKAVLVASSANVYGNATAGRIDESAALAPANDYAVSKLAAEFLTGLYTDRLPLIVVRPFNYTGRGQDQRFLIPKIVAHAKRRADTIQLGNLDVTRDFSDVRTVVQCYLRLLAEPNAVGQTFNVCSGKAYSLRSILSMVAEISGHRMQVRTDPALVRDNEIKVLIGDRSRLEAVIGEIKDIPLEETLRWMLEEAEDPAPPFA